MEVIYGEGLKPRGLMFETFPPYVSNIGTLGFKPIYFKVKRTKWIHFWVVKKMYFLAGGLFASGNSPLACVKAIGWLAVWTPSRRGRLSEFVRSCLSAGQSGGGTSVFCNNFLVGIGGQCQYMFFFFHSIRKRYFQRFLSFFSSSLSSWNTSFDSGSSYLMELRIWYNAKVVWGCIGKHFEWFYYPSNRSCKLWEYLQVLDSVCL